MKEKGKTAIILVGVGARSTHGGGFLYALANDLGMKNSDIMIGSSGDSGNVLYFSAGQYEEMRRIFEEHLCSKKFLSPWRFWRMMDVDYLVDTIFRQLEPLDVEKVRSSNISWHIPITDYETGRPRYMSAHDDADIFEILRASEAIPLYYGKKIPLLGRQYVDGELGPRLEDHIKKAMKLGATKILLINHSSPWVGFKKAAVEVYSLLCTPGMREAIVRDIGEDVAHIESAYGNMLVVSPTELPVGSIENDKEKLIATFARGIADALVLKDEMLMLFKKD